MSPEVTGALEVGRRIRAGEWSAQAVMDATLSRIERDDGRINAFTSVLRARAFQEAAEVDAAVARGRDPGPLAGVPFAVKNLFDLAGEVTLAGSASRRSAAPAPRDAAAVLRLRAAGAVPVGALNMDAYAYGFTTENSHYGPTRNPHDLTRIAGGSSGGSAAAVAAGLVPLSLGSDTNGSIRVPAALCGIFGLKPTYGRLSRAGAHLFVGSLDHIGPFARSVADLAAAYDAMQGPDDSDAACASRAVEPASPHLARGAEGLRIAVAGGWFRGPMQAEARIAVERVAAALGADAEVDVPGAARARASAFVMTAIEGGLLHLPELRRDAAGIDPLIRDRLLAGALAPAHWLWQAYRVRRQVASVAREVFRAWDVLLAPATPMPAPTIGTEWVTLGSERMLARPNLGLYTQPVSLLGWPVVVVPVHGIGALPLGVQVIAAPWREDLCLRVAAHLESLGVASAPVAGAF
jgi:AtzE family amidohydrolase